MLYKSQTSTPQSKVAVMKSMPQIKNKYFNTEKLDVHIELKYTVANKQSTMSRKN